MSKVIHHEPIFKHGPANSVISTTLCGRMSLQDDGMNVAAKVTCKLCLKKLKTDPGGAR